MKINEAHKLFLSYGRGERNYAAETLVTQKGAFRRWIVRLLGDIDVENLTRMDVIRLRTAMVDGKIGIDHQYSILMTLKVFCKFCRTVLKLDCLDPDREIKLPQRPKPFVHYLTNEEVGRMRDAVEAHSFTGLRMRTLIEVLLTTGLRISEALSLDRGAFEAGETEVQIIGKGRKPRVVYFPEGTVGWINRFLRFRADDCPAVFVTTGVPRRWDRNDLSKFFKAVRNRAGIDKPLTPHILRHTYCTNLRDNWTDISLIRELAGHQDIQTTAKYYLGVSKQALRDAVHKHLNYGTSESGEVTGP
jgi:site-specific recombinase XerD